MGNNMKQLNSHDFKEVYKKLDINLDTLGCVMLDLELLGSMGGIVKTTIVDKFKNIIYID